MIKIDKEFKNRMPALGEKEYEGLEQDIIADGCRDALVVWGNILIDGHNRYEICTKHDIPYETTPIELEDREAVLDWMDRTAINRRQLTPDQLRVFRGRVYNRIKKVAHGRSDRSFGETIVILPNTAEQLAEKFDVGSATIKRDGKLAEKVDANPDLQHQIMVEGKKLTKVKNEKKKEKLEETIKDREKSSKNNGDYKANIYTMDYKEYLSTIEDSSVDLLLTDPPFSTDIEDIDAFVKEWLSLALPKITTTGRAYIFIGAYPVEILAYLTALKDYDFIVDAPLIWTYRNTLGNTPKMKYNLNYQMCLHLYTNNSTPLDTGITNEMFSVQDINAPDGRQGDRFYKWQKPDELARRIIHHSTVKDNRIIDPFAGSGTFLIQGAKLGRIVSGCEIDPDVVKIAVERGCYEQKTV